MQFEPIYPQHAIERCSVTVGFHQFVPDKFFARVRASAVDALFKIGLVPLPAQPVFGFQFDLAANQMTPVSNAAAPLTFASADGGVNVTIFPGMITYQTSRYVRWKPFIGQFEEFLAPIVAQFQDLSAVAVVKLEYVDRFFWTGEWGDIDYAQLLRLNSGAVAARGIAGGREWHSHVGWFEFFATHRRLFNINVDALDAPRVEREGPAPSVAITTMAQDQAATQTPEAPDWAEGRSVVSVLEEQHDALHRLLASLITARTADQIGLRVAP